VRGLIDCGLKVGSSKVEDKKLKRLVNNNIGF
jgi:hypothetical protein